VLLARYPVNRENTAGSFGTLQAGTDGGGLEGTVSRCAGKLKLVVANELWKATASAVPLKPRDCRCF